MSKEDQPSELLILSHSVPLKNVTIRYYLWTLWQLGVVDNIELIQYLITMSITQYIWAIWKY